MTIPKVDLALIERAKAMRLKGAKQDEIAVELGISQGTVSLILRSFGLGGHLVRKPSLVTEMRRLAGYDRKAAPHG